jgi:transcriptional regulator with XRE-family HTH domain
MGRASRRAQHHPKRLGEKLRQIRDALELSQNEMLKRLGSPEGILGTSISGYERGVREPPLLILLAYGRTARVSVEMLIDDEMDLPTKLSSKRQHQRRRTAAVLRTKK